jgi:hypothetical protein
MTRADVSKSLFLLKVDSSDSKSQVQVMKKLKKSPTIPFPLKVCSTLTFPTAHAIPLGVSSYQNPLIERRMIDECFMKLDN